MNNYMQYVNSTMKEINDLCAELYESLSDQDEKETKEVIRKIMRALRDVQKSSDE